MICALDPGLRGLGSNAGRGIFFFFSAKEFTLKIIVSSQGNLQFT